MGGDLRPVELELDPVVEGDPERWLLGFTRRIRHDQPIRSRLSLGTHSGISAEGQLQAAASRMRVQPPSPL